MTKRRRRPLRFRGPESPLSFVELAAVARSLNSADSQLVLVPMPPLSYQLSAWVDPLEIAEAGVRYDEDRAAALAYMSAGLVSTVLKSPNEAALEELILEFLNDFALPAEVIHVVKTVAAPKLSSESWHWLETLRFEGALQRVEDAAGLPEGTLFLLRERDAVLDLLIQPVRMLLELVGLMAGTWTKLGQHGLKKIFLEHSAPGPLGVYIESLVSHAYGFTDAARCAERAEVATMLRYRAVSVIGTPPIDRKVIQAMKEAARGHGAETLEPRPPGSF